MIAFVAAAMGGAGVVGRLSRRDLVRRFESLIQPQLVTTQTLSGARLVKRCACLSSVPLPLETPHQSANSGSVDQHLQYRNLIHHVRGLRRPFSTSCNSLTAEPNPDGKAESLVYEGPLTKMVTFVKFFSLSTSIISTGLITSLILSNDGSVLTYVAGSISTVMLFTPFILHWVTKGYVTKMYYNRSSLSYTACTYSFFLTEVKNEFKQSDVSHPSVTNAISSFCIRDKPVLVDPRGFNNPNHYSYLMGYTDSDNNVILGRSKDEEEFK